MKWVIWILAAIGAVIVASFIFNFIAAIRARTSTATAAGSQERYTAVARVASGRLAVIEYLGPRPGHFIHDFKTAMAGICTAMDRTGMDMRSQLWATLAERGIDVPDRVKREIDAMNREELGRLVAGLDQI